MANPFQTKINQSLQRRRDDHRYRSRRVVSATEGTHLTVDNRSLLSFSSNDYLGLAQHPEIRKAMQRGIDNYGVGSGAAHLITGHNTAHHQLEEELAEFVERPRALLFSTGYMANLGTVQALVGKSDAVFEDRLNHASLIDAGITSKAKFHRYQHLDRDSLRSQLQNSESKNKIIVTDSVFSMEGDVAPLDELALDASEFDALLMVDDAHGFGVLGKQGRGSIDHCGLDCTQAPILMATLGKAAGTFGAFVAGDDDLIEYLIQEARTYIYTTAFPPALAEATRASLNILQHEDWRRDKLFSLVEQFRKGATELGLTLTKSQTPIQPIILGSDQTALAASQHLYDQGILVSAIRPPTVPVNSARLRITFSAQHDPSDVNRLLGHLEQFV